MHIRGSRRFKHHQNSTKDTQREKKRTKIVAGEGKKAQHFGLPTLRGLHPSVPPPFGASSLRGSTVRGRHVGLKRYWASSGQAETGQFGPKRYLPKQVERAGLKRFGLNRSLPRPFRSCGCFVVHRSGTSGKMVKERSIPSCREKAANRGIL